MEIPLFLGFFSGNLKEKKKMERVHFNRFRVLDFQTV